MTVKTDKKCVLRIAFLSVGVKLHMTLQNIPWDTMKTHKMLINVT